MGNLRKVKKTMIKNKMDLKMTKRFIKDNSLSKIVLYADEKNASKKNTP